MPLQPPWATLKPLYYPVPQNNHCPLIRSLEATARPIRSQTDGIGLFLFPFQKGDRYLRQFQAVWRQAAGEEGVAAAEDVAGAIDEVEY